MPITQSANVAAGQNQQPEYQVIWESLAINPSSTATTWNVGAVLQFTSTGIGTNPGPGGDGGTLTTPYTFQEVDIAATSTTILLAGVLIGTSTLGQSLLSGGTTGIAPSTISNFNGLAMVGLSGICQVLCDNTTTVGHTINVSTSTAGAGHDTGGTTFTAGSTFAIALQAVTISSGTSLVWCALRTGR